MLVSVSQMFRELEAYIQDSQTATVDFFFKLPTKLLFSMVLTFNLIHSTSDLINSVDSLNAVPHVQDLYAFCTKSSHAQDSGKYRKTPHTFILQVSISVERRHAK